MALKFLLSALVLFVSGFISFSSERSDAEIGIISGIIAGVAIWLIWSW